MENGEVFSNFTASKWCYTFHNFGRKRVKRLFLPLAQINRNRELNNLGKEKNWIVKEME